MHALKILALSLPLGLAAITPRASPGAEQILQSISAIDTAVRGLIVSLNAYNGGINETIPVSDSNIYIHSVNRKGYKDNMAVQGPLSSADSQAIDQRVSSTVGVSIPASIKILEAKKPLFDAAELTWIVLATINTLKRDHETFSAVVGSKLSPDAFPGGLTGAGGIEAALVEASLYYST